MGDEKNEYEIWLDDYASAMGEISIDLDNYTSSHADIGIGDWKDWLYTPPEVHDDITLTGGGEEMLRIDKDGFYVRGVRVEADAREAEQVYNAFKQWLTWASLTKRDEE